MDCAVAAAYSWTDLALDHVFHTTTQGVPFTVGEAGRREVLARLLRLNHARHAAGLSIEAKSTPRRKRAARAVATPTLTQISIALPASDES